jgi:hypothetical protein
MRMTPTTLGEHGLAERPPQFTPAMPISTTPVVLVSLCSTAGLVPRLLRSVQTVLVSLAHTHTAEAARQPAHRDERCHRR